jgi:hypothetical protein
MLLPLVIARRGAATPPPAATDGVPATYFGANPLHPAINPWDRTGFGTLRPWGISWRMVQTARDSFDWSEFDATVAFARAASMDLLFVLGDKTPSWAGATAATPPDPEDWRRWVAAVVARADGAIAYWELYNEPNFITHFEGTPADLVGLAQIAYTTIKAADPTLQVVSPSPSAGSAVTSDVATWMEAYLTAGGGDACDIMAFHGYRLPTDISNGESLVADIAALRAVLADHGQDDKPLWNTESSWSGSGVDSVESPQHAAAQAGFLAKLYLLQWSLGVRRTYWYAPNESHRQFRLWSAAGGLNAAGRALQEVRRWMIGAHVEPPRVEGSVWTVELTRPGVRAAVATWDTAPAPSTRPAGPFTQTRDLDGGVRAVHGSVQLGMLPILLEVGA